MGILGDARLLRMELTTRFNENWIESDLFWKTEQETKTLRINDIHELIHQLPESNFEMLEVLINHLRKYELPVVYCYIFWVQSGNNHHFRTFVTSSFTYWHLIHDYPNHAVFGVFVVIWSIDKRTIFKGNFLFIQYLGFVIVLLLIMWECITNVSPPSWLGDSQSGLPQSLASTDHKTFETSYHL